MNLDQLMQAGQSPHCSLMNYMIPVVAMLVGIAVAGERFEWRSLVALALILLGLLASQTGQTQNNL